MFGQLRNSFLGFKVLQLVDVERCSKNVFRIDCFRWPEGPAETIQYAHRIENAVRNTQLRSNDAWPGKLTTRFDRMSKIVDIKFKKIPELSCDSLEKYHKSTSNDYNEMF